MLSVADAASDILSPLTDLAHARNTTNLLVTITAVEIN